MKRPRPKRQPAVTPARVAQARAVRFNDASQLRPDAVAQALDLFAQGWLGPASSLMEIVEQRDPVIAACRRKRISALARYGYDILTVEDGAEARRHQTALREFFDQITATSAYDENLRGGFSLLARQCADALGKSYSVHEIVLRPLADGGLTAELRHVPLRFFENRTGRLRYLAQEGSEGTPMSTDEWLIASAEGVMPACLVAAVLKRLPMQDWLAYTEKFGLPGVLGTTDAAPGSAEWRAMEEAVRSFMNDWAAVMNQGGKIDLVQAGGTGGTLPFEPLIDRMDRAIATLWRGGDLSTLSAGQGMGQGASLQGGEADLLEQDDAAWLSELLQTGLARLCLRYHFGDVTPLAYVRVRTRSTRDTKLDLEVFRFAREAQLEVDETVLRERLGLPAPAPQTTAAPLANERAAAPLVTRSHRLARLALAADLRPLRDALAETLAQEGDAFAASALGLLAALPRLAAETIPAPRLARAFYHSLSAAAANGLATAALE